MTVRLVSDETDELTTDHKRALTEALSMDMVTDRGTTPLKTCVERAAQSLAQSFEAGTPALVFPDRPLVAFTPLRVGTA